MHETIGHQILVTATIFGGKMMLPTRRQCEYEIEVMPGHYPIRGEIDPVFQCVRNNLTCTVELTGLIRVAFLPGQGNIPKLFGTLGNLTHLINPTVIAEILLTRPDGPTNFILFDPFEARVGTILDEYRGQVPDEYGIFRK